MNRLIVFTIVAIGVTPCAATPDPQGNFSPYPGHRGYSFYGQACYLDPGAQIVQAMSNGLGEALDGTHDSNERREIIGKWLNICEVSQKDVLKSRQKDLSLREENLRFREENLGLREAIFELRNENLRLQRQIQQLQLEKLKLQKEIEKLRSEKDKAASER